MKILYLSDHFPPAATGGAGKIAYTLAESVHQAGHDVTVITAHHQTGRRILREDDAPFPVYRVPARFPERFRAILGLWNPTAVRAIARLLDDLQPDLVHAHNVHQYLSYATLTQAHARGLPVVVTAHDAMSFAYQKFSQFINPEDPRIPATFDYHLKPGVNLRLQRLRYFPLRNPLIRRVFQQQVDALVTPSHALMAALQANGIYSSRMEVIPNGMDASGWMADSAQATNFRRKHGLEEQKIILFGGRVSRLKGGEVLLRALQKVAERVTNVRLLVLGKHTGYANHLLEVAANSGLRHHVIVTGWLSGNELTAAYHAADVCVMPSIYLEPFGLVILEAMAAGKPVVTTCFGGPAEIVEDKVTGFVVNPYDTESMAEHLIRLLSDKKLAQAMGQAGRRRVTEDFSLEKMTDQTVMLYQELLSNR